MGGHWMLSWMVFGLTAVLSFKDAFGSPCGLCYYKPTRYDCTTVIPHSHIVYSPLCQPSYSTQVCYRTDVCPADSGLFDCSKVCSCKRCCAPKACCDCGPCGRTKSSCADSVGRPQHCTCGCCCGCLRSKDSSESTPKTDPSSCGCRCKSGTCCCCECKNSAQDTSSKPKDPCDDCCRRCPCSVPGCCGCRCSKSGSCLDASCGCSKKTGLCSTYFGCRFPTFYYPSIYTKPACNPFLTCYN